MVSWWVVVLEVGGRVDFLTGKNLGLITLMGHGCSFHAMGSCLFVFALVL